MPCIFRPTVVILPTNSCWPKGQQSLDGSVTAVIRTIDTPITAKGNSNRIRTLLHPVY